MAAAKRWGEPPARYECYYCKAPKNNPTKPCPGCGGTAATKVAVLLRKAAMAK